MATCLWTGVAGRAATPDAPLAFFTTLALWLFVRRRHARPRRPPLADGLGLAAIAALAIGGACGLAILTKGPLGLVLPLAGLGLFAWWQALADPGRDGPLAGGYRAAADAWRGIRPLLVTAPQPAWSPPRGTWLVTLRTDGQLAAGVSAGPQRRPVCRADGGPLRLGLLLLPAGDPGRAVPLVDGLGADRLAFDLATVRQPAAGTAGMRLMPRLAGRLGHSLLAGRAPSCPATSGPPTRPSPAASGCSWPTGFAWPTAGSTSGCSGPGAS